jgi:hypothetical protein
MKKKIFDLLSQDNNSKKKNKKETITINYNELKNELIGHIRKKYPNIAPNEMLAFCAYVLATFICATAYGAIEDDTKIDLRKETALSIFASISDHIRDTISLHYTDEKLK